MSIAVSRRTWALLGAGLALTAAVAVVVTVGIGSESVSTAVSDFGSFAVNAFAAGVVLVTALSYSRHEPLRKQWLFIGAGVTLFALGDLTWAVFEVVLGQEPFPSLADAFYLAQYVPFFIGVGMAAFAYRHLVPLRMPIVIASVVAAAATAALYVLLLGEMLGDAETPLVQRLLLAAYPIGDVVLMFAPALLMVLVIQRLGGGVLARPWWVVAAGMVVLAVTDSRFMYLDWNEVYEAGSIVDYGWMLGYLLVAAGACLAYDIAHAAMAAAKPLYTESERQSA